jgi:hypothetical protein
MTRMRLRSAESPNTDKVDRAPMTGGTISSGQRTAIIVIVVITLAVAVIGFIVVTEYSQRPDTITEVGLSYRNQTYPTNTVLYTQPKNYSSVILAFAFENNGAIGPAPNQTFTIGSQTAEGFPVLNVLYCINPSAQPYKSYTPSGDALSTIPSGCTTDGNTVDVDGAPHDASIWVAALVQLPSAGYRGPVLFVVTY